MSTSTNLELERAWQALRPRQRDWLASRANVLDLSGASARSMLRLDPAVIERAAGDDPRAFVRTDWGRAVSRYIRRRPARRRGVGPRPRQQCQVCRRDVAVSSLGPVAHLALGSRERCPGGADGGLPGRKRSGPVRTVHVRAMPWGMGFHVRMAANVLRVECRDICAEALARYMVHRAGMPEAIAREAWRVPEPLEVARVKASELEGDSWSVSWDLPSPGVEALRVWIAAGPPAPPTMSDALRDALRGLFVGTTPVPPG